MTKEDNYLYYRSGEKWEMVMALLLGLGVCLTRLATAASQISLALATVLALFLWWKNGRRLQLSDISSKYIKVAYLFFFATLLSIVDVDNRLYVLQNFLGTWVWRFMVFILIVAFVKNESIFLKSWLLFCCLFPRLFYCMLSVFGAALATRPRISWGLFRFSRYYLHGAYYVCCYCLRQ